MSLSYGNIKRRNYSGVIVFIEEYNREKGDIVFDFLDSNEFNEFNNIAEIEKQLDSPSMVHAKGYKGKRIQENTYYYIPEYVLNDWVEQSRLTVEDDSFVIGYRLDIGNYDEPLFLHSVSFSFEDKFFLNIQVSGRGALTNFLPSGNIIVVVRNVGQGNWNEIYVDDECKLCYDAGAPLNATKLDVRNIIGNKPGEYQKANPALVISHWDKDHYHSLIGMTRVELSNFSQLVCRASLPNLTSRILFNRLQNAIGSANIIKISPIQNLQGRQRQPIRLYPLMNNTSQLEIFNTDDHKDRNRTCISMTLKTARSNVIFSGDLHYSQISRDILPTLNYMSDNYLIVPHHGGKAGTFQYNLPPLLNPKEAIISVGRNSYRHPLRNNLHSLTTTGFAISTTQAKGNDITITL